MKDMERKTDMNNSMPAWIQALGLLYQACEPLTYDCINTKKEIDALIKDIEKHAYFCHDVKNDIENGLTPETWDEWNGELDDGDKSAVEEGKDSLQPIDSREFGDVLTKIYHNQ